MKTALSRNLELELSITTSGKQLNIVARRNGTVEFLGGVYGRNDLFVTSPAVLVELGRGNKRAERPRLSTGPCLPAARDLLPEIKQIAAIYVKQFVMPRGILWGMLFHLAAASFHKCEFHRDLELSSPCQRQRDGSHSTCEQ